MTKKTIKGVLGGPYFSGQYEFPTHSLITLTNQEIECILKLMNKLEEGELQEVDSLVTNIGDCSWFKINNSNYDPVAKAIGIAPDILSNIDFGDILPLTEDWEDFFSLKDDAGNYMVDEYSSGGTTKCVISRYAVYWEACEKHSGSKMESPPINRQTLGKWLKGKF
jgi:hypothetical protein